MPEDIPSLPNVETGHLFGENLSDFGLLLQVVFLAFEQIVKRRKIHKISSIYGNIHAVKQVHTGLVSSNSRRIFDVIDD